MAKRGAEDDGTPLSPLKKGQRAEPFESHNGNGDVDEDFEDEFEDEFDSEDEIFEAGVDGRPDAEREVEEKGTWAV